MSKAARCQTCTVLTQQVAHLQGLVDRLLAERAAAPVPFQAPPQVSPSVPESPATSVPFEIKGEDGVQYVITPDGTLDTKANYDRAMTMLDRTLAGKASYDMGKEPDDDEEAAPGA